MQRIIFLILLLCVLTACGVRPPANYSASDGKLRPINEAHYYQNQADFDKASKIIQNKKVPTDILTTESKK